MADTLVNKLIDVAQGLVEADLVIKNARIVNVFTRELLDGDIAITDGVIAGIGSYKGALEINARGKYACPGLIDGHVHIESSMVTPAEFARTILPFGTTTLIADPHEIANVSGINGIHFMLKYTENLPVNVFFMMPSCVPATGFESNGADLSSNVMEPLKNHRRLLGLGEVMDYQSVLAGDSGMLDKINLFEDRMIDGHSPGLSGKRLTSYRAAGILTDHECSTFEEALERIRLGMYVQIREGSAARNLEAIVKGLLGKRTGFDRCLLCTDDKHLEDIRKEGHISYSVKKAVELGVEPVEAIRMATLNAAQCYGLRRLGAISPGYYADLVLLDELVDFSVKTVIHRGRITVVNGKPIDIPASVEDRNVMNTVRIGDISPDKLTISVEGDYAHVLDIIPGEILTKKTLKKVKTENGCFIPDNELSKLAVLERHKATGNTGLGIVSGFHIKNGAIAGTVAHDSHNLIVIGDNDADMLKAVQEIKRVNGGLTIVGGGRVLETLELPIAGLMSDRDTDYVVSKLGRMLRLAGELGVNDKIDPFMSLSFMALPVIPEIRVTDKGLFDVTENRFISV